MSGCSISAPPTRVNFFATKDARQLGIAAGLDEKMPTDGPRERRKRKCLPTLSRSARLSSNAPWARTRCSGFVAARVRGRVKRLVEVPVNE
jgi:hypothetical protein